MMDGCYYHIIKLHYQTTSIFVVTIYQHVCSMLEDLL